MITKTILLAISFAIISNASTADLADLYTVEVQVVNQSEDARNLAIKLGLMEVLAKVSGDEDISSNFDLASIRLDPDGLLRSYSYANNRLRLNFLADGVHNTLATVEATPWIKRPSIMFWPLVNKSNLERLELDSFFDNQVADLKLKHGLDITLPLWDLDEETSLANASSSLEVRNLLEQLSSKYAKEVILYADFTKQQHEWRVVWTLYTNTEAQYWVDSQTSFFGIIDQGLQEVKQILREKYLDVVERDYHQMVTLTVENIASKANFQRIYQYLQQLSVVHDLEVMSISKQEAVFNLHINQEVSRLTDVLLLNGELQLLSSEYPAKLHYRRLV